jgi:radical SAM superfamily enzyme YgiQ (UPF0313 family)
MALQLLLIDPAYGKHTPFWYVPLGLGYMASVLRQRFGADVKVDMERTIEGIDGALRNNRYDVVAATNYVWNTSLSHEWLRRAKLANPEVITVQGGPHFAHAEMDAATSYLRDHPSLDYYVVGEGEDTFASLIEAVLGGPLGALKAEGLAYLRDRELVFDGPAARIRDLDKIPSPYLCGLLDRFLEGGFTPILETNRGCPFSCTFCNWGSATLAKINQFSLERVREEVSYIARRIRGNDHLTIADANFGVLARDRDIAMDIEALWRAHHYPAHIHLWYAKNSSRRTVEIAEILGKKVRFLLAVQSLDADVLRNIKRQNIHLSDYQELATYARTKNLFTASDLIVGLPGDSLASFRRSLDGLYRQGLDKVDIFNLLLIPGTELSTKASREQFGMQTRFRLADGCFARLPDGSVVVESEDVVIATRTLSQADYFLLRKFHALTAFWHHCGLGDPLSQYARTHEISESDLFFRILERVSSCRAVAVALDYLQDQLEAELYPSHEALLEAVRWRLDVLEVVTRVAFCFARHLIREDIVPDLVDLVVQNLRELLSEQNKIDDGTDCELCSLRDFVVSFYLAADRCQTLSVFLAHDVQSWLETNYVSSLTKFAHAEPTEYEFARAASVLPNEDLTILNPATCEAARFNHWYDRIRNTRGFVQVLPSFRHSNTRLHCS